MAEKKILVVGKSKTEEIGLVAVVLGRCEKIREKLEEKTKQLEHVTEDERKTFLETCQAHMTSICFDDPTEDAMEKEMQTLRKAINKEINTLLMIEVKRKHNEDDN